MKYFYADDPARPEGPVSRDNLLQLFERGEISRTTWVREESADSWCRVDSIGILGSESADRKPREPIPTYSGNSIRRDLGVGFAVTIIGGIVVALFQRSTEPQPRPTTIQNNVIAVPSAADDGVRAAPYPPHVAAAMSPPLGRGAAVARDDTSVSSISALNSSLAGADLNTLQSQDERPQGEARPESSKIAVPPSPSETSSENYSNARFTVPSRLEPQLTDEYWARELESSMRGQGRITPALQKQHLRALEVTKQEKWSSAQELWRAAIEMSLCCGDYLNYNLAVAHANAGDWAAAVEPLKTASGFGDHSRSGYALGVVYVHLGRWKEAAQVLRDVGIYSPYSRDARVLLNHVEAKLKEEWADESAH